MLIARFLRAEYVAKHDDASDPDERARVAVLDRLLFERRFGDGGPVARGALVDNLRARGFADKGELWFRRDLIAYLRDSGLLITSSPHGYKLPASRADLVAFAELVQSVCVPMINRASRACALVSRTTNGDVDVFAEAEVAELKALADALDATVRAAEPEEP